MAQNVILTPFMSNMQNAEGLCHEKTYYFSTLWLRVCITIKGHYKQHNICCV